MPNKDPNFLTYIVLFWRDLISAITSSHVWSGVIMAAAMTIFRNLYDENKKSFKVQMAECVICGCLTYAVFSVLGIFGIPSAASVCIGGGIGFLGVEKIREHLNNFISRKTKDRSRGEDDF